MLLGDQKQNYYTSLHEYDTRDLSVDSSCRIMANGNYYNQTRMIGDVIPNALLTFDSAYMLDQQLIFINLTLLAL